MDRPCHLCRKQLEEYADTLAIFVNYRSASESPRSIHFRLCLEHFESIDLDGGTFKLEDSHFKNAVTTA